MWTLWSTRLGVCFGAAVLVVFVCGTIAGFENSPGLGIVLIVPTYAAIGYVIGFLIDRRKSRSKMF